MKRLLLTCVLLSALIATACGDDAEELTCEMLRDPDFCWNAAVTEAYACTSDQTEQAVSSDDGATCVYPDGPVVTLDDPIPPGSDRLKSSFSIERDGETCISFRLDGEGQTLSTPSYDVTIADAGTNYRIECGGTAYEESFFTLSDQCGEEGVPLSGAIWSGGSNAVIFMNLMPRPDDIMQALVDCAYAE